MPILYKAEDLETMARAYVDKNIDCSPGSEQYLIWVERVVKDLAETFTIGNHPHISF